MVGEEHQVERTAALEIAEEIAAREGAVLAEEAKHLPWEVMGDRGRSWEVMGGHGRSSGGHARSCEVMEGRSGELGERESAIRRRSGGHQKQSVLTEAWPPDEGSNQKQSEAIRSN